MALRDNLEEIRELGVGRSLYRIAREVRMRSGAAEWMPSRAGHEAPPVTRLAPLPLSSADSVRSALSERIPPLSLERLGHLADDVERSRIFCFGRMTRDFGTPFDWYLHPSSGLHWDPSLHWSRSLRGAQQIGDVKLTWEPARFPQAYHLARAATFRPEHRERYAAVFAAQVRGFLAATPFPLGIHWFSGQELVIRLVAWLYGLTVFGELTGDLHAEVARYALVAGHHIEDEIGYARRAVYNNHLIAEALGLYLCAWLLPGASRAEVWSSQGLALLTEQAERQVYPDGGYINQSHNYHRVVMHDYLLASILVRARGGAVPPQWTAAIERSLDLLVAHQNPSDGRLPNYGANDGSLPRVLSTCDFSDFRPTLQAMSLLTRGERLYPPGPWDEESAWLLGPSSLDAPLREPVRRSVSFATTGYHVLRGSNPGSFATLRCGTLLDRFTQIDMLHADVWWRGQNVIVDGGSFLYNGPPRWHAHFLRTEGQSALTVDGRDQMLHLRQFKTIYGAEARLLRFDASGEGALCVGEHDGFKRHPGGCVHRRAVLRASDDLFVVVDTVTGVGAHEVELQWLCGPFEHAFDPASGRLRLSTPEGDFSVAVYGTDGRALEASVVAGQESPPRGWLSRYYSERVPTPSFVVKARAELPLTWVSVLGAGAPELALLQDRWSLSHPGGTLSFVLRDGLPDRNL